jgi:hypothetical protein
MAAAELTELVQLEARTIAVTQIFLDPHNPRLMGIDHGEEPTRVPDDEIPGDALQADLLARLRSEVGIDDLAEKIKKLGFLTIDRIVVRPLAGLSDMFVVLEGNRRVAAAKTVRSNAPLMATLPEDVRASLEKFEVLVYEGGNEDIAWELQGLRHMGGVRSWGPYQQARFLVDLKERRGLPMPDVAQIAGIGRTTASRLIRSYYGFMQAAEDEDFGDRIGEQDFSVFQEAVFHRNNSPLWTWLGWDDNEHRFEQESRLTTLLSLLKDTETPNGQPRIARVNPDLRDKFSKLLSEEYSDFLEDLLADRMTLEQATQHVQTESQPEIADLHAWRRQLAQWKDRLASLPIPSIIEQERSEEFAELLESMATTIQIQIRFIESDDATPEA